MAHWRCVHQGLLSLQKGHLPGHPQTTVLWEPDLTLSLSNSLTLPGFFPPTPVQARFFTAQIFCLMGQGWTNLTVHSTHRWSRVGWAQVSYFLPLLNSLEENSGAWKQDDQCFYWPEGPSHSLTVTWASSYYRSILGTPAILTQLFKQELYSNSFVAVSLHFSLPQPCGLPLGHVL